MVAVIEAATYCHMPLFTLHQQQELILFPALGVLALQALDQLPFVTAGNIRLAPCHPKIERDGSSEQSTVHPTRPLRWSLSQKASHRPGIAKANSCKLSIVNMYWITLVGFPDFISLFCSSHSESHQFSAFSCLQDPGKRVLSFTGQMNWTWDGLTSISSSGETKWAGIKIAKIQKIPKVKMLQIKLARAVISIYWVYRLACSMHVMYEKYWPIVCLITSTNCMFFYMFWQLLPHVPAFRWRDHIGSNSRLKSRSCVISSESKLNHMKLFSLGGCIVYCVHKVHQSSTAIASAPQPQNDDISKREARRISRVNWVNCLTTFKQFWFSCNICTLYDIWYMYYIELCQCSL